MAAKKVKLKIIKATEDSHLSQFVEEFILRIINPETMQIQFEVAKTSSGAMSFFAFILFDGELTKGAG